MTAHAPKLILSVLLAAVAALGLLEPLDRAGEAGTERAMQRALAAFAIARGLNGAISFAQGTEVALQPAGVGLTLTPGELLDPLNDLVERFSWVMLASSVSLGLQRLLIEAGRSPLVQTALTAVTAACIVLVWLRAARPRWLVSTLVRLVLVLAVLRFAAPLFALGAEWCFRGLLAERHDAATRQLEATSEDVARLSRDEPESPAGGGDAASLWERMKRSLDASRVPAEVERRFQRYLGVASAATETIVELIVVFLVQTLVLPLLFLWLLYATLRWVAGPGPDAWARRARGGEARERAPLIAPDRP